MTTHAFHLQIISPAKVVVDAHVPSAEIPGLEGDFGVLPGHAPFFSMLKPGIIGVTMSDGSRRHFFAASGYADVTPEKCTLLSDHIQDLAEISLSEAQEALNAAQQAIANAKTSEERVEAETLMQSAEALMRALNSRAA